MALPTCSLRPGARAFAPAGAVSRPRGRVVARLGGLDPSKLQEAMKDPAVAERMKQMQEMMAKPEMQQQLAEMQAYMQNQALQQRMQARPPARRGARARPGAPPAAAAPPPSCRAPTRRAAQELRSDPEFAGMFAEIQAGGMGALMKYMNDPKVLAKLGEKLGDVPPPSAAGAAAAAAPPRPAAAAAPGAAAVPEIDNLFDAAKYGDLEAVEDFIAIGKDVNAGDAEARAPAHAPRRHARRAGMRAARRARGARRTRADARGVRAGAQVRTPLHWACGYNHLEIAKMLIDEGAALDARDSKENTPLHYAAGYGRGRMVELLLASGADVAAKNDAGKSAYELATLDERNPLNQEPDVLAKLKAGAA
ncbi:AKR2A [Scenedesmus sp. PABB004]|nr:AKR2A [Scenedesmus sp. PABB004]